MHTFSLQKKKVCISPCCFRKLIEIEECSPVLRATGMSYVTNYTSLADMKRKSRLKIETTMLKRKENRKEIWTKIIVILNYEALSGFHFDNSVLSRIFGFEYQYTA